MSIRGVVVLVLALLSLCFPAAALPSTEFGSQSVGSPVSGSVAISLTAAQLQAGVSFSFHYGTDFTAGSCSPSSGGCQLAVTFRPTLPGSRSDAVIVKNASGTVLSKAMVHGTGLGPMLQFNPGTSQVLYAPPQPYPQVNSVAVDGSGNVFFLSGSYYPQLMKLTPGATTPQTLVSTSVLYGLQGVGVDGVGNVYYSDTHGIEEIDADTGVTTLVTSAMTSLFAVDIYGNLYGNLYELIGSIATVQRFDRTTGILTTIAGTTTGTAQGDGGPAVNALLSGVRAIAVDPSGNLYIAEQQGRIRKVDAVTQIITTIAGNDTNADTGDGGPASAAQVARCASMATDAAGNLYLASEKFVIRKIDASTGIISTVAGTPQGTSVKTGELSNTVQIAFYDFDTIAVDSMGNLFATADESDLYEFSFQSPTLPFTAPGSGPNPSLVESLLNVGNQPLAVSSITASGSFALQTSSTNPCGTAITLSVGSSCQTVLAYNASNSSQTGSLTVTGNFSNMVNSTQQAALSLVYPQAVLEMDYSPVTGPLSFGSVYVGGLFTTNHWLQIQNSTIATLQIPSISFTGPGAADFSIETGGGNCSGGQTGPYSYCLLDVLFQPQAAGVRNATMVINSNAAQPTTLAVTGTAMLLGVLTPSVSQLTFTLPASGAASSPKTITLLNTGETSVGFFPSFYYWLPAAITTVSNSCNGISSLAPGASCSITLQAAAGSTPLTSALLVGYSNQTIEDFLELNVPVITVDATPPTPLNFVPVTPCRVADTRNPTGDFGGPYISGFSTRSFTIPSSACNIPSTAAAYSLNVAVVPHGELGYLTAWATGQPQPYVSTINSDGRIKSTAAIVPAGTNGAASFYATNDTDLVLDINGYFVASSSNTGLNYYVLNPCRVLDTRNADGTLGGPFLNASQERDFPIQLSSCNVPSAAQAYSINLAVVPLAGELGALTLWPTGESQPDIASLNATTGAITSNAGLPSAGTSGDIEMLASNNTQAIIDINGYFAPATSSGLHLYTITPCRVLDTRSVGTGQPFTGTLTVTVGGGCSIPSDASAVVVNATVVPVNTLGYLTLWADGQPQPVVATLNASDGAITSNLAIVPMVNGAIDAFATNATHLVVDAVGYFAP